jgi:hypothetical protein
VSGRAALDILYVPARGVILKKNGESPAIQELFCYCFFFGVFPYHIVDFSSNCHLLHKLDWPDFLDFLVLPIPETLVL